MANIPAQAAKSSMLEIVITGHLDIPVIPRRRLDGNWRGRRMDTDSSVGRLHLRLALNKDLESGSFLADAKS